MADVFDPYHKWLGIPPKDQPPHHYRLLGIDAFESDTEVIDAAANRQMAYVQACADGPHLRHSQKLLNEISAARVCLLSPERRAAYDAQLRERLPDDTGDGPVKPPPVVSSPPRPAPKPAPQAAAQAPPPVSRGPSPTGIVVREEEASPAGQVLMRRQRTRTTSQMLVMLGGLAVVLVIAVLLLLFAGGPDAASADGDGEGDASGDDVANAADGGGAPVVQPRDDVIDPESLPGMVLDNKDGLEIGNVLSRSPAGERFVGSDYNVDSGSGEGMAVRFVAPSELKPGWYEVRVSYVPGDDRASNTKVEVRASNQPQIAVVNQRQPPKIDGLFHSLGRYQFDGSGTNSVLITSDGADGTVVVDAVQFLPADAPEVP